MDRRDFMKKLSELVKTSATGITLSKLQITAVATGLSSLLGCSRDYIGDTNEENNPLLAPLCNVSLFACDGVKFVCEDSEDFTCGCYDCNAVFECQPNFLCKPMANFGCYDYKVYSDFSCAPSASFIQVHDQGTIG